MLRFGYTASVVIVFGVYGGEALASDYGTTGLIDVPSARFEIDGILALGASIDDRHRQFSMTYQATPWLQATFRYTGYQDYFYWDRNYEVKARLISETDRVPQMAVGIRDIVGTGNFGSEYVVASKRFDNTDFTIGLGWGRLSGNGVVANPLKLLGDRFSTRESVNGVGGEFLVSEYFAGDRVGIFGGVSHQMKELPVTLVLEYNPDEYDFDFESGVPRPKSPWSLGVTWHAIPNFDIRASFQHADSVGLGFQSFLGSQEELPRRPSEDFISSYYLSQDDLPSQISKKRWYDRLLYDVERSGLLLFEGTISADETQAKLVVGNLSYSIFADAIGRHTALADLHLPPTVRLIHFTIQDSGYKPLTIVVPRPSAVPVEGVDYLRRTRVLSSQSLIAPQNRTSFVTGKVNTTLNLKSRFQLFDPDDPARYQIYMEIGSEYALTNEIKVSSSFVVDIENNFNESNRQESNSVLPKVRSNVAKYLAEGDSGLEKIVFEGRRTFGRSIHARGFAGYLESMFAGAGGEVLYWPFRSRIALGASLAFVKQRDFDRGLDLLDYQVLTGHLSAYWASPFYNYDVALHVGRYLAKDRGATFEIRRTFRNGWQVGVWASMTNVPFEDFGEGSFDKGFTFQIPLDGLFKSRTRSKVATRLRPIQRDGGQRLDGFSGDIFWELRESRYDAWGKDHRLLP